MNLLNIFSIKAVTKVLFSATIRNNDKLHLH